MSRHGQFVAGVGESRLEVGAYGVLILVLAGGGQHTEPWCAARASHLSGVGERRSGLPRFAGRLSPIDVATIVCAEAAKDTSCWSSALHWWGMSGRCRDG